MMEMKTEQKEDNFAVNYYDEWIHKVTAEAGKKKNKNIMSQPSP